MGQRLECVLVVPVSLILEVTECVYIHLSLLYNKDSESWVPPFQLLLPFSGQVSHGPGRVLTPPPFPAEGKGPVRP